jgi:hypothetical protein
VSDLQTLLDDFAHRIGSSPIRCRDGEARFACESRFEVHLFDDTEARCLRIGTQVGQSSRAVTAHDAYWACIAQAHRDDPRFEVGWNPHTGDLLGMSSTPVEGLDGDGFAQWIEGFLDRATQVADAWLADPGWQGLPVDDCRCFA